MGIIFYKVENYVKCHFEKTEFKVTEYEFTPLANIQNFNITIINFYENFVLKIPMMGYFGVLEPIFILSEALDDHGHLEKH